MKIQQGLDDLDVERKVCGLISRQGPKLPVLLSDLLMGKNVLRLWPMGAADVQEFRSLGLYLIL